MNSVLTRIYNLRGLANCGVLAIVSAFLAWRLSGLRRFDLSTPLVYEGDGIAYLWHIKRVVEGTWFSGSLSNGYPFVSHALDQPGSDYGSYVALRIIDLFTNNVVETWNLYFLIGFVLASLAAYFFMRRIEIRPSFAFAGALLFAFMPFHLARMAHLFLTWYFVAPIFFWYGYQVYLFNSGHFGKPAKLTYKLLHFSILIAIASFGVYYAFFGAIVIVIAGIAGAFRAKSIATLGLTAVLVAIVASGVLMNITPSLIYQAQNPPNKQNPANTRQEIDSESYGLKITQLVMPKIHHRNPTMAKAAENYTRFPLTNENTTASLGLVGAFGLLCLFGTLFIYHKDQHLDGRLHFLSIVILFLILASTVGGFSSLFAQLVTPLIRAWNRISVFIGIGAIAAALLVVQILITRYIPKLKQRLIIAPIAFAIFAFGIWDQTSWPCHACISSLKNTYENDQIFVSEIEAMAPNTGTIYQLPYMGFPEVPQLHQLPELALMKGYLHSDSLRWSYGNFKGRSGANFYQALSQLPLADQLTVVKRLGFDGIYIDRRGYPDFGQSVEAEFTSLLNAQGIVSPSNQQSFFEIVDNPASDVEFGAAPEKIMAIAGFVETTTGWVFQED
jgi:phosphoglycerol transferase